MATYEWLFPNVGYNMVHKMILLWDGYIKLLHLYGFSPVGNFISSLRFDLCYKDLSQIYNWNGISHVCFPLVEYFITIQWKCLVTLTT